jgi:hypothetical protein
MVRFYLLLLLTVSSLAAFAQTKPTSTGKTASARAAASPKTYTGRVITVTNGGGFTGRSVSYYLQDDGRLYGKRSSDATYAALGKQTKANTKRVFWSLEDRCKIKTTQFDNPGNTYKSVTWQKGKERYNVTWGSPKDSIPANYEQFYKSFMAMIPASLRLK